MNIEFPEYVKSTFSLIENAKTINDLVSILNEHCYKDFKFDDSLYPAIDFSITKGEIENLKAIQFIDSENNISNIAKADPLAKLLYALAWKNGDLKKIKHIIQGISDCEGENTKIDALVFYQFGKHLNNKTEEPIIDQHVLRAYGIWEKLKANNYSEANPEIDRLKKLSSITKKEKDLIERYKNWLRTDLNEDFRKEKDYAYHVDKVLFAIGKSLKIKKEKQSSNK